MKIKRDFYCRKLSEKCTGQGNHHFESCHRFAPGSAGVPPAHCLTTD